MSKRPNILYLHCHDAGRYIEPFGYKLNTPHLQGLAEEGVLFRQAHCVNPTCSPSRAGLLTGQCAHSAGMYGLAHRGWTMKDYGQTMMSVLRKEGYHTVLCGQQHVANPPFAQQADAGYDEVLGTSGDFANPPTLAERFLARQPEKPFFLDVGFFAPHRFGGKAGDFPRLQDAKDDRYLMPPACLPDTPETRRDYALYASSVEDMDQCMGRALKALETYGYADNTLVICTTDHGLAFPHMKCRLTDHGTGVFLIMRGPGGFTGGKVVDALVSHSDVFPTVCDLTGVGRPDWLQGKSLSPLVNGEAESIHEEIFTEVNYHASREPMRAVRNDRWKYIRRYEPYPTPVYPNTDNSISKLYLHDRGWRERPYAKEELYDLVYDPQETCNLAEDPEHGEIKASLKKKLSDWMEKTGDPLVDESAELPTCEGIIVTDQGAYSPGGAMEDERDALVWTPALRKKNVAP